MAHFFTGLHDVQQNAPVEFCPRCGGEVYRYDEVSPIDSGLVHEDCMTAWEREDYMTHPAISYFMEEC